MENLTVLSTPGLVKPENEDVLAVNTVGHETQICLCDGHWGKTAADLACSTLISHFPTSRLRALRLLRQIERRLFTSSSGNQPPETSVLSVKVDTSSRRLTYMGYGDCRLLVARSDRIIFSLPPVATWLGALSYRSQRGRLPVKTALIYGSIALKEHDTVLLFTDGIDECIYNQPTIPHSWLVKHTASQILKRVLSHGAEDNASLIILKC